MRQKGVKDPKGAVSFFYTEYSKVCHTGMHFLVLSSCDLTVKRGVLVQFYKFAGSKGKDLYSFY